MAKGTNPQIKGFHNSIAELHISIHKALFIIYYADLFELWGSIKLTHRILCNAFFHQADMIFKKSAWCPLRSRVLTLINTLRPRQNGRRFQDDIFKWIFLNENVWISIEISLKFVPKGEINNIPALVRIMAWRRPGCWRIYASLGLNELRRVLWQRIHRGHHHGTRLWNSPDVKWLWPVIQWIARADQGSLKALCQYRLAMGTS